MTHFWDRIIYHNPVRDWAIAFTIIFISIILLRLFQSLIIRKVTAYSARTKATIDDYVVAVIQSSGMPLLYVLAVYVGLNYINLPAKASRLEYVLLMLLVTFFLLRIVTSFISYSFGQALAKKEENGRRAKQARGILMILQALIWLGGIVFLIDNLGYDITTLIAGLGIGGIAIALAAQTILGDLFSYLVIFFDKPFEIGDFIVVGDKMGTVEYIGIKTTRIRTLGGEQLVCSNTDLTNSRVHNHKRMQERRVAFTFGVTYDTPADKLRLIPQLIREMVESQENTRFERAHFQRFGDFSLSFEAVYHVLSPDANLALDIQQAINLMMFERFEKEKIAFAFPTQTLLVNNVNKEEMYRA